MTPSMDTNSMTMTRPIFASSVVFARNEREAVEGTAVAGAGYSGLRSTSRRDCDWGRLVRLGASATHEQLFAERWVVRQPGGQRATASATAPLGAVASGALRPALLSACLVRTRSASQVAGDSSGSVSRFGSCLHACQPGHQGTVQDGLYPGCVRLDRFPGEGLGRRRRTPLSSSVRRGRIPRVIHRRQEGRAATGVGAERHLSDSG